MSNIRTLKRGETANHWSARDLLLLAGVLILLGVAGYGLSQRDRLTLRPTNLPQAIARLGTADFHALAFKPDDPETVYFGHHYGVMRSTNGGVNWTPLLNEGDAMSLGVLPDAPDSLIAAGHLLFIRSDDRGTTWQPVQHDLPYDDIHGFAVNPQSAREWYAFVVGYGLYRSQDAGSHWAFLSKTLPDTTMALVVVPGNPAILFAGTMDRGVLKSADGGVGWMPAGIPAKSAMTLGQDPQDPRKVYAGTEAGLYRMNMAGTGWDPMPFKKGVMALAVSHANPSRFMVVASDGRVYRSEDSGKAWGN